MTARTVRCIRVAAPGVPAIFDATEPEPGPGEAWIRTLHSGMSAGTEVALVAGTDPHHVRAFDRDLRVFDDGPPRSGYPIPNLGYMEVGEVVESRAPAWPEGTRVAAAYGHRTARCLAPGRDAAYPLPPDLDALLGVYVAQMGPIAVNGLLHAAHDIGGPHARLPDGVAGRLVLVVGAGVVGLLCAFLAELQGALAVAVVAGGPRRVLAGRLGLTTYDEDAEPWRQCKQEWSHGPDDRGADVVFQCRGRDTALATALKAVRPQGTIIDLAFYQDGAGAVRLGEEFHHNGLAVRCAQIGRVPRDMADRWDRRRLSDVTVDLLRARGHVLLEYVVTDRVPFEQAPAFLADLAARRRTTVSAVIDMPPE